VVAQRADSARSHGRATAALKLVTPLTWSAHSAATREELYHDQETMRMEQSGQVTATVSLRVILRTWVSR
jgi:hypothetical protein